MLPLEKLRSLLAEKIKALADLEAKALADEGTKDDIEALKAAMAEIRELKDKIAAIEEAKALAKEAATPIHGGGNGSVDANTPAGRKAAVSLRTATPEKKLGIVIQGMVKGYKDHGLKGMNGLSKGLEELGYSQILSEIMEERSLNTQVSTQGGVILGETFNADIIKILYPMSSFMAGNPRRVEMPTGSYRQPAGASGATASYTAEGEDITVSQPTFREINMTSHKLAGIVPITNELLQYSQGAAEEFVKSDLASVMSTKADSAMYLGTGLGDSPVGLFNIPGIYSTAATNSTTPTQAQVDGDARKLRAQFIRYPILQNRLAWRMSPSTWQYLVDMTDGNGNYIYPTLNADSPRWKGLPLEIAGTFPENLGGGTNETYLALIAFGEVLYGETRGLEMAVSDEASIKVAGNLVSMFSTDQTAIRVITAHDVTTRYLEAVAVLTGVKWGR